MRSFSLAHVAGWVFPCAVTCLLSGCGVQTNTTTCSVGALTSSSSADANFQLQPVGTDFTIFPGGTTQVPVYIASVNGSSGTVQLGGASLPQGITVAPALGTIGSTTTVSVTAAPNVVSACFQGILGVYTAATPVTLSGATASSKAQTQVAMNVVLENPSYTPAPTNVPILTINTTAAAPVDSEDTYVDATMTISDPANSAYNYSGALEIKGHGNTTWQMPKKPYRLNLNSKAPLLGMASDTNWILLANYDDKTLLRNDVTFYLSNLLNMTWTPSSQFVELYLNGQYEGSYELTEKVEVSKARLNIGSLSSSDNTGTSLTGGYLAEIDQTDGETYMTTSPVDKLPIGIYDPSTPTTQQEAYFTSVFDAAESGFYASNFTDPNLGWRELWDQTSLVQWFLVEEIAGNKDANDGSDSVYFYKPNDDPRFYMGPVWDFDVTYGNDNAVVPISQPNVPWVSTQNPWYLQLFKDPTFLAAVKAEYAAVRPQLLTVPAYIDTRAAALAETEQNNFGRWPTLSEEVWPNQEAAGTYQGEINFMKQWYTQRLAYMDATYLQ